MLKNIIISVILLCSSYSYADAIQQCNGMYLEFLWTEKTIGDISPHQNYNVVAGEDWGIGNVYPLSDSAIKAGIKSAMPYRETDPGFNGPNGELWGIEVEFGNLTIPPRFSGAKNAKFYTDFGQTNIGDSGVDRAEIHMGRTLENLGVNEGDTLWLGWSEYYSHIDSSHVTTVLQFRNQPSVRTLREGGFSESEINRLISEGVLDGGPATGITTIKKDGKLFYDFSIRQGTTKNWTVPEESKHTSSIPIQTGKWYDFVVQMKFSQNEDGRFRVWIFEVDDSSRTVDYQIHNSLEWGYEGSTMYDYPDRNGRSIPFPSIRFGVYRHDARKQAADIREKDRYMIKYLGPLRFWVGESDIGFNMVKPREIY